MNRFVGAAQAAFVAVALAATAAPSWAADPSLNQVYEAVHAGHLNQAQGMMSEVLHDHPNSAKAHYVEAEILAKQGRAADAQGELARAEQLAPGLPFAAQASVQELRGVIASESGHPAQGVTGLVSPAQPHAAGFPWALVLIALVIGLIVFAIMRARRAAAMVSAGAPYPYGGATPSYGAPPMAPMGGGGIGSGILGGLATGAAVGAGMVAGEALAHDLIDGHGGGREPRYDAPSAPADNDLGGQDFGISDAGSWDDGGGLGGGGGDWN